MSLSDINSQDDSSFGEPGWDPPPPITYDMISLDGGLNGE